MYDARHAGLLGLVGFIRFHLPTQIKGCPKPAAADQELTDVR